MLSAVFFAIAANAVFAQILATNTALGGKLFFDPAEREQIDRERHAIASPSPGPQLNPTRQPSVVNGFVKRSDGVTTVWVDDEMKNDLRKEVPNQLTPGLVGNPITGMASPATAVSQNNYSSVYGRAILSRPNLISKRLRAAKSRSPISVKRK